MHLISDTTIDWLTVRQPCGDSDSENELVRSDRPRLLQRLHRAYVASYNESPVCMVYVDSLILCTVSARPCHGLVRQWLMSYRRGAGSIHMGFGVEKWHWDRLLSK